MKTELGWNNQGLATGALDSNDCSPEKVVDPRLCSNILKGRTQSEASILNQKDSCPKNQGDATNSSPTNQAFNNLLKKAVEVLKMGGNTWKEFEREDLKYVPDSGIDWLKGEARNC